MSFLFLALFSSLLLFGCVSIYMDQSVNDNGIVSGTAVLSGPAVKQGYITCALLKQKAPPQAVFTCVDKISSIEISAPYWGNNTFLVKKERVEGGTLYTYTYDPVDFNYSSESEFFTASDIVTLDIDVTMPGEITDTNGIVFASNKVRFQNINGPVYAVSFRKDGLGCVPFVLLLGVLTLFLVAKS